jgi:N-acetylmuramoyl-L-alanine amidase
MRVLERPSPNHGPRRGPGGIDILLIHYTGMPSAATALDRLCDPLAEVSAHYLIAEDGAIWRLVDEARRAWHAGSAFWAGERDINSRSIGIELANPGHEHGYRAFPEPQLAALAWLGGDILARHAIPAARILGHSDVAPLRKEDPGELFPWERMARAGLGLWPDFRAATEAPADILAAQQMLARIGYETPSSGVLDAEPRAVITAFQRHWRPARCDGALDAETALRIAIRSRHA